MPLIVLLHKTLYLGLKNIYVSFSVNLLKATTIYALFMFLIDYDNMMMIKYTYIIKVYQFIIVELVRNIPHWYKYILHVGSYGSPGVRNAAIDWIGVCNRDVDRSFLCES